MDTERNIDVAVDDDRHCISRGYHWPSDAYTDCRRFLLEARQRERWQELQMMRQQQQHPVAGIGQEGAVEPLRPIREDNFACKETFTAADERYIDCRETR